MVGAEMLNYLRLVPKCLFADPAGQVLVVIERIKRLSADWLLGLHDRPLGRELGFPAQPYHRGWILLCPPDLDRTVGELLVKASNFLDFQSLFRFGCYLLGNDCNLVI